MTRQALLIALTVSALGCADQAAGAGGAVTASPAPVERRTTSGSIALANLGARIEMAEWAFEQGQNERLIAGELSELYAVRVRYLGSFGDLERIRTLSMLLVGAYPSAESYVARASFLSSVHEFDAAAADLARAASIDGRDVNAALFDIQIATGGDLQAALAFHRQRADASPSFGTLSALATAEAALGEFEAADVHYLAAAAAYRDVSPLPLAWLAFARGVMWAEQANSPQFGRVLYEEAVARLPDYVVANVHLAELEAAAGDRESAIERLTRVAETTSDPEPAGLLAELLQASDPEASRRYGEVARRGYDELLQEFRLAFADHAAEFFAGPVGNDPERALELGLLNLEQRPTPRAYQVAINAAQAAQKSELVCELVSAAEPLAGHSTNLRVMIDEIDAGSC
jgi:tetratricopeptide (TPR) repeat protein